MNIVSPPSLDILGSALGHFFVTGRREEDIVDNCTLAFSDFLVISVENVNVGLNFCIWLNTVSRPDVSFPEDIFVC